MLEIQNPTGDEWTSIDTTRPLSSGDHIRTGNQDSQALVTWFNDESSMTLETNTDLTFATLDTADDTTFIIDMELVQGRLLHNISEPVDATLFYRIQTQPGAAITAQNAVFAIDLFEDGTLSVAVAEGEVGILEEIEDAELSITATPEPDAIVETGRMVTISPNGTSTEISLQAGLDGGDVLALILNDFYREVLATREATPTPQ